MCRPREPRQPAEAEGETLLSIRRNGGGSVGGLLRYLDQHLEPNSGAVTIKSTGHDHTPNSKFLTTA